MNIRRCTFTHWVTGPPPPPKISHLVDTFHFAFCKDISSFCSLESEKSLLKISLWSHRWADEPETQLVGLVCAAPFWMWKRSETFGFVSSSASYAAMLLQLIFFFFSNKRRLVEGSRFMTREGKHVECTCCTTDTIAFTDGSLRTAETF